MFQDEDIEYFKTTLLSQLDELQGSASHVINELLCNSEKLIDEIDKATVESSRGLTLRIKDRESRLIGKIIQTLKMIEDGTFGYCQICGEEIGLARLKARPVAMHCIRCKTKLEANEKLLGD